MPQLVIVKQETLENEQEALTHKLNIRDDIRYQIVDAEPSLTPDEIVLTKLGLPLRKEERIPLRRWRGGDTQGRKCTLVTNYQLHCLMLSNPLQRDISIGQQGIIDKTIFILEKDTETIYDRPEDDPEYGVMYNAVPIGGVRDFNRMVQTRLSDIGKRGQDFYFSSASYTAVMLYTDEDVELAKFVRENYTALNKMSGEECDVFVIERSPQEKISEIVNYWIELVQYNTYILWGGLGWIKTKPYDKSAAHEIAKQLGVFAHQLPCIVFFDDISEQDKIIIPLKTDNYTNFFRLLFGSLQELTPKRSYQRYRWELEQEYRKGILRKIRENLMAKSKKFGADEQTTTYVFQGNTVFINHPTGSLKINDFQNNADS